MQALMVKKSSEMAEKMAVWPKYWPKGGFFIAKQSSSNKNNVAIPTRYPAYAEFIIRWHVFCHISVLMGIRIDNYLEGSETVISISGRLSKPAVAQLNKVCDPIEKPFVIDLSNLIFADDDGIDAILAIMERGAQIYGASPFVRLLLDNPPGWKNGGSDSKPF